MYYQTGSRLKNGKATSEQQMVKYMTKEPNAFEGMVYTLPADVALGAAGSAIKVAKGANQARKVGWKLGESIDNLTAVGKEPSWWSSII